MARESKRITIDSERFEDIEGPWRELFDTTAAAPFSHPQWIRAWMRTKGSVPATVYLAIRRGEQLIGLAPLELGPVEARFAGDANVFDYAPLLATPGEEVAVMLGLLEWLREDMTNEFVAWGLVDGMDFAALADGASNLGWDTDIEEEAVAPRAILPGNFEEFLAGLSKKDRHELRRKFRNFEAAGTISFERASTGTEFEVALDALIAQMAESHSGKVDFLQDWGEFFRQAALALASEGLAAISTVNVDGTPAARTLTFESRGTCYLYNSGYDPAFADVGAGLASKAYVLRDAIEGGLTTFDFLRGDEEYKLHMGGAPSPIWTAKFRQR